MSFYNVMHGMDPHARIYLDALSLSPENIPRFRDAHLSGDGTRILLLTRTGGGNRPSHDEFFRQIRQHPCYIRDYDDGFDSTFAHIEFRVPDPVAAVFKLLATGEEPLSLKDKTDRLLAELKAMTPEQLKSDPRMEAFLIVFKMLLDQLGEQSK